MGQNQIGNDSPHQLKQTVVAGGLVIIFLLLTWYTARAGFSSLLSAYAAQSKDVDAANWAVRISPTDPDAHFVRGAVLEARVDMRGAADAYGQAALVRPDGCVLWLGLARTRELSGDANQAIAAARKSVPLAPYYAQPHWQLGNILLRAGQRDEAFQELRLAAASNPTLIPGVVDLAWRISGGNVQFLLEAIQPKTPGAYQTLGRFLRHHGDLTGSLTVYAASGGNAPEGERRGNLEGLIEAKRFQEAFNLWVEGHAERKAGVMVDPGYEEERDLHEPGFGWRVANETHGFHLSLDTAGPRQGRSSLKVDFEGDSNPASPVISQLVLVEPRTQYQLKFSARTEGIVSGGLPRVVIIDAGNQAVIGQSELLPQTTGGWRDYMFEFNSGESGNAVQINLQREICNPAPCPIFGRLWLDNLWLQKL